MVEFPLVPPALIRQIQNIQIACQWHFFLTEHILLCQAHLHEGDVTLELYSVQAFWFARFIWRYFSSNIHLTKFETLLLQEKVTQNFQLFLVIGMKTQTSWGFLWARLGITYWELMKFYLQKISDSCRVENQCTVYGR